MVVRKLITGGALLTATAVAAVEVRYRRHAGNDLAFTDEDWAVERGRARPARRRGPPDRPQRDPRP